MDTKPQTLYHGSSYKIKDDFVHVKPNYLLTTKAPTEAVFASSDFARARLYAVMNVIGKGWLSPRNNSELYVEKTSHNIPEKAYVYELNSDNFEHDTDTDYYSLTDKKIQNVIEIDIMQEIKNGTFKIYVLKDNIDFAHMQKQQSLDLWHKTIQHQEKFELYTPTYYHGSSTEITDDYLRPVKNFNSVQDSVVSGAFVTSEENYAKFFAINDCISGGHTRQENKTIYLERLLDNIKPEFFVYTVYETPDNQFIHDKGTEYYSTKPIKIAERKKYNTAEEIEKAGYQIYVLDEPLKSNASRTSNNCFSVQNNFSVQAEMDSMIKQKKYHRVDIPSIIKQQQNTYQTMVQNISHQKDD